VFNGAELEPWIDGDFAAEVMEGLEPVWILKTDAKNTELYPENTLGMLESRPLILSISTTAA
jgi:hypothetical protein